MWRCSICETLNDEHAARCVVCETPRSESGSSADAAAKPGGLSASTKIRLSREVAPAKETASPRMEAASPRMEAAPPRMEAAPMSEVASAKEIATPSERAFRRETISLREPVPPRETTLRPEPRAETYYPDTAKPGRVRKWPWLLAAAFLAAAATLAGCIFIEFRYQNACELYAAGDYAAAQAAYSKIEWYRDSAERANAAQNETYIANGRALMGEGDYSGARASFEMAGADGQAYIEESRYRESEALQNAGNYAAARDALAPAADDPEKQNALANIYYAEAAALCGAGDYAGAQTALENADSVEDVYGIGKKVSAASASAKTPVEPEPTGISVTGAEDIYAKGIAYLDADETISAQLCFMQAAGYSDSFRRACELAYINGMGMAAGGMHCVWLDGGAVYAEGNNYYGQCNVSDWEDIVQVDTGRYHTVGLKADGTVVAVGSNDWGQCRVDEWTGIVVVAAGGYHTVGLKADGTVVAVGWDAYGQCGVRAWTDVVHIAAGERHTVGVKADGTAIAAGDNSQGQRRVSAWQDIIDVTCGQLHTVGLKSDGTLVAVGGNEYGQCNVTEIENAVAVDAGRDRTVCLTMSGEIMCVGNDAYGQGQPGTPENIYALCTDGAYAMYFSADGGRQLAGTYYSQLSMGAKDDDVALLQRALTDAGWYAGEIDGIYDEDTAQAVSGMQTAMGREPTGVADSEFLTLLYADY